jgi:hypothetical protein
MWLIAAGILGVMVVLVVRAISDQKEILRDWDRVLSPWGLDAYREMEQRIEGEAKMAEYAFRRAFSARAVGSSDEAVRLLDVALQVVERTSPDRVALLREMVVVSRMAAAISAVGPLQANAFRLPRLSTLAVFAALAHQMLFSASDRFRLRAFVLRRGFGMVSQRLLRSRERIESGASGDPEWERIEAARADLQTLSTQSLHTFHTLLASLSAS